MKMSNTSISRNTSKFSSSNTSILLARKSSSSNGFHNLPSSVLLNIFSNFTEEQLQQSVIPVCQTWRYAALDPSLWKKLSVKGDKLTPKEICQRLRQLKNLEDVYLKKISGTVTVLRQVILCSKRIKRVTLRYCEGLRERNLRNMISACSNLELIDLKGTVFKGYRFYQDLPSLVKLKSLNISGNTLLTKENILTVALNCRNLDEFILSVNRANTNICEAEWSFMISALSGSLKSICIDASGLGDQAFHSILECPLIEKIGFCSAFHLSGDMFVKLVKYPIELKVLKLRNAHLIDGPQFEELFRTSVTGKLEVLDLTGCWRITDEALDAISRCTKLKRLNLKNCKRITTLDSIIANNEKLEEMNIAFCSKLSVNSSLLSMPKLMMLFINEDEKFDQILRSISDHGAHIKVKICLSEYNKKYNAFN